MTFQILLNHMLYIIMLPCTFLYFLFCKLILSRFNSTLTLKLDVYSLLTMIDKDEN